MMEKHYRCWAEIDRSALRHNVAFVRQKFGPDIDLLAVVKANAYGHGMIEVAQTIADQANIFGVANLDARWHGYGVVAIQGKAMAMIDE